MIHSSRVMIYDFRIAELKDLAPLPDPGSHSPSSCYLGASLSLVTWVAQFGSYCDAQNLSYCDSLIQPFDNPIMSNTTSTNSHLLPSYTPQNPFCLDSVKNPWSVYGWKIVKCNTTIITGPEITDSVLLECVNLYNTHFGVWSEVAEQFDHRVKAG